MAKMNYLDFDLLIDQSKTGFKVQVLTAPAGVERASGEFTLPFDEKDIKIFMLSIGQPRRGVRRRGANVVDAGQFGRARRSVLRLHERDVSPGPASVELLRRR